MCDMFNHGAEPEVEISLEPNTGDCYAISIVDVPAGGPVRASYGDPADATTLFANTASSTIPRPVPSAS